MSPTLKLTSRWTPAPQTELATYALRLSNMGSEPIADFALGLSGQAANIDPECAIEGGTLRAQLSNYSLIAPPQGLVLQPGGSWDVVVRTAHLLRHWSDGVGGAYVVGADGRLLDVSVAPTECVGSDAPPRNGAMRFPLPETPPVNLSIIPWPNAIDVTGARTTPGGLDLRPEAPEARAAAAAFTDLVGELFPSERLVRPAADGGMPVRFNADSQLGPEAYELTFDATGATIAAGTRTGFLYGLVSLGQILRGARRHPDRLVVPATGTISDAPALGWRGTHLDVARQFFPATEVNRLLRILAWNRMNRFHWHLSDDEAWRLEIDAYPDLTAIGAWQGHGLPLPPLLGGPPSPTGGFYSKAEIRQIVALGETLGIIIVPEIDIPGHSYAALAALPWLRDPGEIGTYQSVQGFPNNCLNPARASVYRFIETVIDEMLELFPAHIFHLGADEVPLAAWSGSPEALALLSELVGKDAAAAHQALADAVPSHGEADAIEGSGTAALQARFIGRVHRYLAGKGAMTGGWQEAAHGGVLDKSRTYLVGWRNVEVSAALAAEGYDIVVAPGQRYYLDMANGPDWAEPGASWAGSSSPKETYDFEPRVGWSEAELTRLLGVQCCIWSESTADRAIFDRLVFPRISAVAETGWTQATHKSWARFSAFAGLMPILNDHWADE